MPAGHTWHLTGPNSEFFSCHAWRLLCRLGDKKNKSNKNSAQERWELQTGRRMKNQKQTLGFINLTLTIWHSKLHKLAWQIIAHFLTKIRSIKLLNWLIFCSSLSPVSTGRIHPSSTTQTKNIYLRTSITCKWKNISPIRQSLLGACWGIFWRTGLRKKETGSAERDMTKGVGDTCCYGVVGIVP